MKPLAVQTNRLWRVRRLLAALFAVSLCLSGITTAPAAVVITYFQNDATGTPVVATSATGTVLWRETHQPYGVRHTQQAEVASYPLQFTGHAEDPNTGMVYTGARMYDPSLARFTGADPAPIEPENPRSFTRYGYGNNNPYRNVDPDGESPIDIAFLAADTLKLSLAIYSGNAAAIESALGAEAASLVGVFNPIPFSGQAMKAAVFASRIKAAEKGIAGVEKAAKGAAGGARGGKSFTAKGKAEIDAENATRNGGTNICESCGTRVVPGQQARSGIKPPENERHRDHIIPKSRGGDGDPSNGQILCRGCNLTKSDSNP